MSKSSSVRSGVAGLALRGRPGAAVAPPRTDRARRALQDQARVERLSRTFKALGDPTRSKIVYALSLEELCVSELADLLGASLSATSHQLRILRDLDIVRVRRQGKSQVYALNERAFGLCPPRSCQAWQDALRSNVRPARS
ncbi:MAG TPA: metalloregulator ArsR/SmtB family transcription factor [Candidatus Eisenbacteria bacterium]|jgi:DNA-binding transcriptional ArsR family regulator